MYLGASAPVVYNVPIVVVEHYGTLFLRGYMAGAPLFDCSEDATGSGWTAGRVAGKAAGDVVLQVFLEAMPLSKLCLRLLSTLR